jgi:type II secretory ATPase GspE/PulE/Tfp pilus assembly ATPase PilB-like protein
VGIYEVMPITDGIAKLILERSDSTTIEAQAKKEGMITMKQDGYLKVLAGVTTIDEILRVAQE